MSRALVTLRTADDRERACRWIRQAPPGSRIEFKSPRRTLPQNDRMWAMLTEVSTQLAWHGQKLTPDDWKDLFMGALRKERLVPGINGGLTSIGMRTSDLTKEEMSDLIELIDVFAAEHGVTLNGCRDDASQVADADTASQVI
jgi:hypothetical protein